MEDAFAITFDDLVKTLEELNNIDNNVEFTMKSAKDEELAFLDYLVSINEIKKLRIEI